MAQQQWKLALSLRHRRKLLLGQMHAIDFHCSDGAIKLGWNPTLSFKTSSVIFLAAALQVLQRHHHAGIALPSVGRGYGEPNLCR